MVRTASKKTGAHKNAPIDPDAWLESLAKERPEQELELIRRACEMAEQAHSGQYRASGEPYFQHSLAVADILTGLNVDAQSIAAAILHDVAEDTEITLEDIEQAFDPTIAKLVDGVTKMDVIQAYHGQGEASKKERAQAESLRKMLLAMVEDVRVVLIKLADRLHNMRTLASLPEEKQLRIAKETQDIFAPLANRLGIWQIKWELEDLSFRYLQPEHYKKLAKMLDERRVDREDYISRFIKLLGDEITKAGIDGEVNGRPKHIYSIWRKMQLKNLDYHEIYDVRAVRIIVKEIKDCYAALGVVHNLWQYLPGEFDDYIANPKENNYQSLHTAIIGPEGKTVEIQIRTQEMHQKSELGVAAHWRYKEGRDQDADTDRKVTWLRQLLDWKEDVADASEFVDQFKSDVFEQRVYVFTPKGNVVDLLQGATPLDFAYHIHTEVGHRCRGAKVDGRIVPLTYRLQTGEKVEILTVKRGDPSRDWLNPHLGYLKTPSARAKVQRWFKLQNYENNVTTGRSTVDRELNRLGLHDVSLEKLARRFNFDEVNDFMAAVGRNDIKISQFVHALQSMFKLDLPETDIQITPRAPTARKAADDVSISGVGNLLTQMARCCKPVPGDPIVGYITRGRGVTIHRSDCKNALHYSIESPERLIEVEWGLDTEQTYPVDVEVISIDRPGLLRDITSVLANEKINLIAANTLSNKKDHTAKMTLTLEIADLSKLSIVLGKINQLPNVMDVRRPIH